MQNVYDYYSAFVESDNIFYEDSIQAEHAFVSH